MEVDVIAYQKRSADTRKIPHIFITCWVICFALFSLFIWNYFVFISISNYLYFRGEVWPHVVCAFSSTLLHNELWYEHVRRTYFVREQYRDQGIGRAVIQVKLQCWVEMWFHFRSLFFLFLPFSRLLCFCLCVGFKARRQQEEGETVLSWGSPPYAILRESTTCFERSGQLAVWHARDSHSQWLRDPSNQWKSWFSICPVMLFRSIWWAKQTSRKPQNKWIWNCVARVYDQQQPNAKKRSS